jgi:hypothetical protein
MAFTMAVAWVYLQPLRQDSAELRATSRLPQPLQEVPLVIAVARKQNQFVIPIAVNVYKVPLLRDILRATSGI